MERRYALLSFKENSEEERNEEDEIPEWTKIVNRGGLYQCYIEFFDFLCAVESVVKGLMRRGNEEKMKTGFASLAHEAVLANEDVLFHWSILCASINNELPLGEAAEKLYNFKGTCFCCNSTSSQPKNQ